MSVLIDVTPLLLRSAGVKSYIWHWTKSLVDAAPGQIRTFPAFDFDTGLDHERSMAGMARTYTTLAALYATNYLRIPIVGMQLGGAKLFHSTNQVRRPPKVRTLTSTLHDLTCWSLPSMHTEANVRADREFAERVWKRADALIAVSENTRRDAIEYLGIAADKVITIHSGVDEAYFGATIEEGQVATQRYNIAKPFVLALGTIEPRKNTVRLLDAWEALPGAVRDDYELVFAGGAGWADEATVSRLRDPATGVRWLGYVEERYLPGLTKAAAALAYPSLYEGFGFPVAQAMATSTAVLTSNVSSLPEVGAGGCEYVDPLNVDSIRNGLVRLLESSDLRRKLGDSGRQTAEQRYRWSICATRSLELFRGLGAL